MFRRQVNAAIPDEHISVNNVRFAGDDIIAFALKAFTESHSPSAWDRRWLSSSATGCGGVNDCAKIEPLWRGLRRVSSANNPDLLARVGGRMGGEGHTVPGMVSVARPVWPLVKAERLR